MSIAGISLGVIARLRSHQSSVFQCVREVCSKVFGVVGEVEAFLFNCFGRKLVRVMESEIRD
ncbi:hypothetical protein [Nostoc sp. 'Peltigera membranacea cyanobiont' 232]|uniref:hypothetical protein n=1 Tax=Nostoc sp. 'Peltigera membranacea cyanobiont' 232 TaxID=2014531 RepID=UPI0016727F2F|nr:hypothetical protein [Nostoc sp. 'Peltigera membranacea cyanobiont' 232]